MTSFLLTTHSLCYRTNLTYSKQFAHFILFPPNLEMGSKILEDHGLQRILFFASLAYFPTSRLLFSPTSSGFHSPQTTHSSTLLPTLHLPSITLLSNTTILPPSKHSAVKLPPTFPAFFICHPSQQSLHHLIAKTACGIFVTHISGVAIPNFLLW